MSDVRGKIIVEIQNGELRLLTVANSDAERAALLEEFGRLLDAGDLAEALERAK